MQGPGTLRAFVRRRAREELRVRDHRIRISVARADYLNHLKYPARKQNKAPTITLHRDAAHASFVELPMMKAR